MAFLKALAKVGLVELEPHEVAEMNAKAAKEPAPELSDEELAAILAEDLSGAAPAAPAAPAPQPAPRPAPSSSAAAPGVSLDAPLDLPAVYQKAQVPEVPYAAETLLKVLDGLKAMDAATRKTAIMAMDAADDKWTIADPVLDAQRKIEALGAAKADIASALSAAQAKTEAELTQLDAYQAEAIKTIREKIAEFEASLEQELKTLADQRAQLKTGLQQHKEAVARESARLDDEIGRLSELKRIFGPELSRPQS